MDDYVDLVPRPKTMLRGAILIALLFLGLISNAPAAAKIVAGLTMVAIFGTFPYSRISAEKFQKTWHVLFIPVYIQHVPLGGVDRIETGLEQKMNLASGCAIAFLVGIWNLVMIWLLDWLIPWAGGDYKLWLRLDSGRRVLAWQGNGEANFRQNVHVLEDASGLPVVRG
ncbi:MAG: hypothetical protein JW959_12290 [Pirellulales bacterium]|nr:hypothetical protein [Pirellulales bacterium]